MSLVVSNKTYDRFIIEPDEDLDWPMIKARDDLIVAASKDEVDEAELERLTESYKQAQIERVANGKRINVTFRPLRARDKAAIEDMIQMEYGSNSSGDLRPGTMRMHAVRAGVVSWGAQPPWSEAVLANLDVEAYEALHGWISWGVEPAKQDEVTGLPLERTPPATSGEEEKPEEKMATSLRSRKTPVASA